MDKALLHLHEHVHIAVHPTWILKIKLAPEIFLEVLQYIISLLCAGF